MKVLIFGIKGYLGQKFLSRYPDAAAPLVDIADAAAVSQALNHVKPDIVINAAGKTGVPNVDWCEDHKLETIRSNVAGPLVLLDECAKRGIYWVHLSSGCIYAGDNDGRGFSEEDTPNFGGSFYSRSKIMCETVLREFAGSSDVPGGVLILRLRMPFDGSHHPRNLLVKLKNYTRVNELTNSITHLDDFLSAAATLIDRRKTGIYNVVNPGVMSPLRIMELYREIVDPSHAFERLPAEALSGVSKAARSNCVLSTAKLESEGIALRGVEDAVRDALKQMRSA